MVGYVLGTERSRHMAEESEQIGRVVGIAYRPSSGMPMTEVAECAIEAGRGLVQEERKSRKRQVTLLSRESWSATCAELGVELPWPGAASESADNGHRSGHMHRNHADHRRYRSRGDQRDATLRPHGRTACGASCGTRARWERRGLRQGADGGNGSSGRCGCGAVIVGEWLDADGRRVCYGVAERARLRCGRPLPLVLTVRRPGTAPARVSTVALMS